MEEVWDHQQFALVRRVTKNPMVTMNEICRGGGGTLRMKATNAALHQSAFMVEWSNRSLSSLKDT